MALTKRQITTGISVLFLIILTVLAAIALHRARELSLPISDSLGALVIALPPLAGVIFEFVNWLRAFLAARGQGQFSRIFQVAVIAFLVLETVLATLTGTHISPPGNLDCGLQERWQKMFSNKDAAAIRRIQDEFSCCGFRSPIDRAFPFRDRDHDNDACMIQYERTTACVGSWRSQERHVAGMMLAVPVAMFLWMALIILAPSPSSTWLPSAIRLPGEEGHGSSSASRKPRQAIGFYRDVENADEDGNESIRGEVDGLNSDSNLASRIEAGRSRSNGSFREHENWREAGNAV